MAFENTDVEPEAEEAGQPPEESSNRIFIIAAAILGAITLLALLCIGAYAFLIYPSRNQARQTENAVAIARLTEAEQSVALTRAAQSWTATPTPVTPTATKKAVPTNTLVVAAPNTATPAGTSLSRTATVAAFQTQIAALSKTPPAPTSTSLPNSGFADEVGLPVMFVAAVALVGVIVLARRLRTSSST